jgi:hypothetical protein
VYDEKKKAKLTVFSDYSLTLHKMRLNFSSTLILETKQDEEMFEEYDPDWLFLKVVRFDPSLDESID